MDLLEEALSHDELDELDDFLTSDIASEWLTDGSMLHGFFTALVVGPVWVPPSMWLRFVWGEKGPAFESSEQAKRILGLIYRFYDSTRRILAEIPEDFWPMLKEGEMVHGEELVSPEEWCVGFCCGLYLQNPHWKSEFMDKESILMLAPMLAFVFPDEMEEYMGSPPAITRDEFLEDLPQSVRMLSEYWKPHRQNWTAPATLDDSSFPPWAKGGADAPCACGSGKECKECCDANPS